MANYVMANIEFRDVDSRRINAFDSEMEKRKWDNDIRSSRSFTKRIDRDPEEKAKTDIRRSARDAGIKNWDAVLLVSDSRPRTF